MFKVIKHQYCDPSEYQIGASLEQNIMLSNKHNINKVNMVPFDDIFMAFTDTAPSKWKINKDDLYKNFNFAPSKLLSNIPKNMLFSKNGIFNIIINEIERINNDMSYPHYIKINNNNIFDLSFFLIFNLNVFELKIALSSDYPFMPPKVILIKPKVNITLLANIMNMSIWDPVNWNYTISLEWLIVSLADKLELLLFDHLDKNPDSDYNMIELKTLELFTLLNIDLPNKINIMLEYNKKEIQQSQQTYWKSGTGYASGDSKWDISKFIDINMIKNDKRLDIIKDIYEMIINKEPIPELFINHIIFQFKNSNVLDINKNLDLYNYYFDIIDRILTNFKNQELYNCISNIINDINHIIKNEGTARMLEDDILYKYLYFTDIYEKYKKDYENNISNQSECSQSDYITLVKDHQYDIMELSDTHRYYSNRKDTINPKTITRIMAELASIGKDLPAHWDSSILFRIIPSNMNMCSFLIVGPKDTPYHNGLFEFHTYFPDNYPKTVPQVLINTTYNDTVRFNPNLYACGKVCLSLLGTWRGEAGESWIPDVSTFMQVMISIQSLIFVDEPYFNEPGYESKMGTEYGKEQSREYNDNIRYETIRIAMVDMLKKAISGEIPEYADFIIEHFKMKKDEIYNTIDKWIEMSEKKDPFIKVYDELKQII